MFFQHTNLKQFVTSRPVVQDISGRKEIRPDRKMDVIKVRKNHSDKYLAKGIRFFLLI